MLSLDVTDITMYEKEETSLPKRLVVGVRCGAG
jgi:hypothetical protein